VKSIRQAAPDRLLDAFLPLQIFEDHLARVERDETAA